MSSYRVDSAAKPSFTFFDLTASIDLLVLNILLKLSFDFLIQN